MTEARSAPDDLLRRDFSTPASVSEVPPSIGGSTGTYSTAAKWRALYHAIRNNRYDVVKELLANGAIVKSDFAAPVNENSAQLSTSRRNEFEMLLARYHAFQNVRKVKSIFD